MRSQLSLAALSSSRATAARVGHGQRHCGQAHGVEADGLLGVVVLLAQLGVVGLALPQGLALLAERFHRRPALLPALLGHGGSCTAGRALVLAKLKLQAASVSFQSWTSTSSAGNLPASPSAISRSSTGAPRASSSCRRLTSSREAPRFSASASTAAFSTGLSCSRRSRTWVAILNFFNEQKKGCGIGRNYSGHSREGGSTRRSVTSRLNPHMPLVSHKLRALSLTRAAQWASSAGRSANVPPAFQKRAWAGSLAFSIQSPPRDCLTEGSSRWRTASGVSFASKTRSDAAASYSTRSVSARSQKSLARSSVAKLTLGRCPSEKALGSHEISSEAPLCQNSGSRHKNLPPLALAPRPTSTC